MNNITFLHTIYVNYQQRAVFDGSLEGLRTELGKLGLNASDLENQVMFGEAVSEEIAEYLFDMDAMACYVLECDVQGIDEMGVYLHLPEMEDEPTPVYAELSFPGDAAQECVNRVMAKMGAGA